MKPRSFSGRRLRRIASAKLRAGATEDSLSVAEQQALREPKDVRCRWGVAERQKRQ